MSSVGPYSPVVTAIARIPAIVGAGDVPRRVADEDDLRQRRAPGAPACELDQVRPLLGLAAEGAGALREEAVEGQAPHPRAGDGLGVPGQQRELVVLRQLLERLR